MGITLNCIREEGNMEKRAEIFLPSFIVNSINLTIFYKLHLNIIHLKFQIKIQLITAHYGYIDPPLYIVLSIIKYHTHFKIQYLVILCKWKNVFFDKLIIQKGPALEFLILWYFTIWLTGKIMNVWKDLNAKKSFSWIWKVLLKKIC